MINHLVGKSVMKYNLITKRANSVQFERDYWSFQGADIDAGTEERIWFDNAAFPIFVSTMRSHQLFAATESWGALWRWEFLYF